MIIERADSGTPMNADFRGSGIERDADERIFPRIGRQRDADARGFSRIGNQRDADARGFSRIGNQRDADFRGFSRIGYQRDADSRGLDTDETRMNPESRGLADGFIGERAADWLLCCGPDVDRIREPWYHQGFLLARVPVSSRGQDTWFSATGPGFESPYRYQLSKLQAFSDL
jgi:hypothetical protein